MITRIKSLTSHAGFRRYGANTAWMFSEQILRMIAGLLVGIWVARYLGPEQFGIFSYALAFTGIFSGIAKLGLDGIIVRDLLNDPGKRDFYLGTAFWLKIAGALLAFTVITIASFFTSNDTLTNLYIFIIASGMIFQSFEVIDFYFQSKILSKFVSISKMTQLFISSLLKIYFVLTGADLIWFVFISAFDQFTLAICLIYAYRKQSIGYFIYHFNFSIAKRLLFNSWPLIFGSLVVMIYMRIDQIMIKEMLGAKEVGIYSAAVRLSEVWYFIPTIIASSIFPAILAAKQQGQQVYHMRLQQFYTVMAWLAISIAVPMTFLSDWIIVLLYGAAYSEAGSVLMINIWTTLFVFIGVAFGRYLTAENLTKTQLYRTLFGAVVNVILNLILIPIYGIKGAAIATFFAQFSANFIYDIFDPKLYPQLKLKILAIINPLSIKGIK